MLSFRRRHNITNKKIFGESLSANEEVVEPYRKTLDEILKTKIQLTQLCNYDETGLYWRTLPDTTQGSKAENTSGRKISEDVVSALLCASADGSHMLTPVMGAKVSSFAH